MPRTHLSVLKYLPVRDLLCPRIERGFLHKGSQEKPLVKAFQKLIDCWHLLLCVWHLFTHIPITALWFSNGKPSLFYFHLQCWQMACVWSTRCTPGNPVGATVSEMGLEPKPIKCRCGDNWLCSADKINTWVACTIIEYSRRTQPERRRDQIYRGK